MDTTSSVVDSHAMTADDEKKVEAHESKKEDETIANPAADDVSPPKIAKLGDSFGRKSPLRRSQRSVQKTGSIVRGRPNTIRSGLPSPYRQVQNFRVSPADESTDSSSDQNESLGDNLVGKPDEGMDVTDACVEKETADHAKLCQNVRASITLREKSVSTPNVINQRKRSLRKIASSSRMTSHTGAKFAPLSKDTAEILTNIGEMVTVVKMTMSTPKAKGNEPVVKWINSDKFFKGVLSKSPDITTKRDSVLRIEKDNAGNVRANVSKFNGITSNVGNPQPEFKTPIGIVPRTPRRRSKRRAKTLVRIPSVFIRNSGVTDSIRNQYKNVEPHRRASLRIAPTLPLTTFVKQTSNGMAAKRRHSSIYRSGRLSNTNKSPLRDSNVVNIRLPASRNNITTAT